MTDEPTQFINKVASELIAGMGIKGEIFLSKADEGDRPAMIVQVKTEDSRLLIGEHGANLQAFQHLLRVLVNRQIEQQVTLIVDVNDYRSKKQEVLLSLAKRAEEKVKTTNQLVILKPMSAYERRIIHTALSESTDVATESLGEDPNRRVGGKPKKKERQTLDQVSEGVDL